MVLPHYEPAGRPLTDGQNITIRCYKWSNDLFNVESFQSHVLEWNINLLHYSHSHSTHAISSGYRAAPVSRIIGSYIGLIYGIRSTCSQVSAESLKKQKRNVISSKTSLIHIGELKLRGYRSPSFDF